MPKLAPENSKATNVKMLLLGDSGTGKTGAVFSLIKAGYKVSFLDMDNKVESGVLPKLIRQHCPDKLGNVDFEPLRDKIKMSAAGPILDGIPTAYTGALRLMDKWSDGTAPKDWGPQRILVLDSLTFFADAAFNWSKAMNPSAKDPRQWYFMAQEGVEHTLAGLTAAAFNTNVIVTAHVSWVDRPDGTMKGYPASIGKALGPTIPAYFDNMAQCQTTAGGKRTIQTLPTALIDLKNPAFSMAGTLPIESGLATFFETLKQ